MKVAQTSVNITIAGTPHNIVCPQTEVENVRQHAERLHENLINLRQEIKGKNLNNEVLLVLHCFELYDQLNELKARQKFANDDSQRAQMILDKLIDNAKALL